MARVHLVRHGTTTAAEGVFSGSQDLPLSEHGQAMAQRLSKRLSQEQIDSFYSSHKIRAIQTAHAISLPHVEMKGSKLIPSQLSELGEISHGRWEGKTKDEVIKEWPDEYEHWEEDPCLFAPLGGENGLSVIGRAIPAMDNIIRANAGKTAVVVSHKATLRLIICHYLGLPYRQYRDSFDLDQASLTTLVFKNPTKAKLTLYNDTSHYQGYGDFIILVNGRQHVTTNSELSYADIVALASGRADDQGMYTVIADDGDRARSMIRGDKIKVRDGMKFDAVITGAA